MKEEIKEKLREVLLRVINKYSYTPLASIVIYDITRKLEYETKKIISTLNHNEIEFPIIFEISDIGKWELLSKEDNLTFIPSISSETRGL